MSDVAVSANNMHPVVECSNKGTCDRKVAYVFATTTTRVWPVKKLFVPMSAMGAEYAIMPAKSRKRQGQPMTFRGTLRRLWGAFAMQDTGAMTVP